MAAFSTNVIEMPDLASRAYQMYQIGLSQQEKAEEKAKIEREKQALKRERYSDVEGTRGMLDKAYTLEPAAREVASLLFKEFEKASIDFNTTGSEQSKNRLDDLRGKLNRAIGQGMAIADQKKRESEEFRLNPQMFTPDSERNLSERIKPIQSFKPRVDENGVIVGTYNGQEMPIMDIPYFGSEIIPGLNALGLDRIDNTIKVLNPENMAKSALQNFIDANGVRQDFGSSVTYNKDNLIKLSNDWLTQELAIPKAMEMVFIFDAANKTGFDPEKLSTSEYLRILDEYKNPELAKQAVERYKTNVLNRVQSMIPAAQVGAARGGGGGGGGGEMTEAERERIDFQLSVGIPSLTKDDRGKDVLMWDGVNIPVKNPETLLNLTEQQYIKSFGIGKDGNYRFIITDSKGNIVPKFVRTINKNDPNAEWNSQTYRAAISDYLRNLKLESEFKRQAQAAFELTK